jgi:hypothetical protein
MKYILTLTICLFLTINGFGQDNSYKSPNQRLVLFLYGGAANSFDDSADDHYQIGFKLSLPYAFHIKAGAGTRPVEPLTRVFFVGLDYDIFHAARHRVYVSTSLIHLFRRTHSLFDDRVWKQTVGAGYQFMPFKRFGLGIDYYPVGFYHGTRKDNPEKGNPSLTGAGEFHVNLYVSLFKL